MTMDGVQILRELLGGCAFEHVPAGAGLQRGDDEFVVIERRHHEHLDLWIALVGGVMV